MRISAATYSKAGALALWILGGCASAPPPTPVAAVPAPQSVVPELLVVDAGAPTESCLLLLPGGRGAPHFTRADGRTRYGSNFLMRALPKFSQAGHLVIVPSVATGVDSASLLEEAGALMKRRGCRRAYLVATSRGAISAMSLLSLSSQVPIGGVVLASPVARDPSLARAPLPRKKVPFLVLHHRGDACQASPFRAARDLVERLERVTDVTFGEIEGGSSPAKDPCGARTAHGFWGAEKPAVEAILEWLGAREREAA